MVPRQKIVDLALPVAVDERLEGPGQEGMGLDLVELRGFDQGGDHAPVPAAFVVIGEEGVLPVQGDRADGPLDGVAVDLDAPVLEEQIQAAPELEDLAQRLAERRLG